MFLAEVVECGRRQFDLIRLPRLAASGHGGGSHKVMGIQAKVNAVVFGKAFGIEIEFDVTGNAAEVENLCLDLFGKIPACCSETAYCTGDSPSYKRRSPRSGRE